MSGIHIQQYSFGGTRDSDGRSIPTINAISGGDETGFGVFVAIPATPTKIYGPFTGRKTVKVKMIGGQAFVRKAPTSPTTPLVTVANSDHLLDGESSVFSLNPGEYIAASVSTLS